jgi:hypothetical protein
MMIREEVLELLRSDQAFREEMRRQLLTEDLLALPARFEQLAEIVREVVEAVHDLTEAQHRTDAAIRGLMEAQQRTDAAIRGLTEAQQRTDAAIRGLTEAQRQTEVALRETQQELRELVNWQRGEAGRREGERYERETVRRGYALFNGGHGGSPDHLAIQQQLSEWLKPLAGEALIDLMPEHDPFLADLVWWKGERVAVVEVSAQVNGYDVFRADSRAETLRQAGVHAFPVVIGKDWASEESRSVAQDRRVEWKVGSDLSEGFVNFRKAAST